ncbi:MULTISPECIES: AzlD domain-containing protein [Pseudonocardia]|uniref:Branched-chain amino acid transport protein (AzlD) n=2 Tax=Pseudonocardia TaxID=1847 RepID=A0A1Y2N2S8_PSEAH|nr:MULTISPECIES: AzlD domain-containing protein [Pseudonocardia]OSY41762.1 Branched-chain amino acid transport protein (AzlD) [Pseudonocardia autotrophica]TDN71186.1 branched-subunit amino acid transport protein AzlD [Pseudonocardia autotrophica]BBG01856.1 branched-chain amino acid transporter [Pseudonocardia autotrophica]GEC23022.1 branched-chain amino acid transporter [Pseudonocardia saturnea]
MTVAALVVLAGGTYLLRLLPLLLHGRITFSDRAIRLTELGAVALLVALVATGTWFDGDGFAGWARPAGVAVAALAVWLRLPFVLVVLLAAGTTALLRLAGVP